MDAGGMDHVFQGKRSTGVKHVRHAYTGGAAMGPDHFRFFHAIGVNLKQIYGQTEIAGISVVHRDGDIKFDTVGTPIPETEIKIGLKMTKSCQKALLFLWATTSRPRKQQRP